VKCSPIVAVLVMVVVNADAGTPASPAPLPPRLAGRWTAVTPSGVFTDRFEMSFEGDRQPGEVTGRATFRGVTCGSKDEPFRGTWDGNELRVQTMHRANVNTQRSTSAACGPTTYVLRPRPGASSFTGEGRTEGMNAVALFDLSP
jgi:hypothetical protein